MVSYYEALQQDIPSLSKARLVSWYLVLSYAYYVLDESPIPDAK